MEKVFKILSIVGSPHDGKSNTKALIEDFVDEMKQTGLNLENEIISLGRKKVEPCRGCWNCTNDRACPIKDDLAEIKIKMLECDMLILGSPVYTNQVSAQMKAFCDRLFTWCHIFPLLGKYSLSVVSTGNDGHKESAAFLEKMLATYGTFSFGSVTTIGAFTPGFYPWREHTRSKNKKKAQWVAKTIMQNKKPSSLRIQKKMFRLMRMKMTGVHTINCLRYGEVQDQPKPNPIRVMIMKKFFNKMKISDIELDKWGKFLSFELNWWRDRNWLKAKSIKDLINEPIPSDFHLEKRLTK